MIIEDKRIKNQHFFKDLAKGQIFHYSDQFYIKTDEFMDINANKVLAINIKTGSSLYIAPNSIVTLINKTKLIIEE
mgnify:CR=1 FL=1